ncbi:DUF72 domain-containing protein [Candidatus Bipolaricaulota bacterium]|nr:DUF72 domain-containing protein [Candidatus Bipolaricaulota bacterium]
MELRIGCCGWAALRPADVGEADWRGRFSHKLQLYALHFPLVEVNSTFYRLPRPFTADRWRALADGVNREFEFAVKVHQDITHKARFRGREAREAWARSAEVAHRLRAKILLLQCPASFGPTPQNMDALCGFLAAVDRDAFLLVWEPRGEWGENPERVAGICREFSLVHCADPFKALPVTAGPIAYLRLHGSPPGERMYRYTYTDQDLQFLVEQVRSLEAEAVYVLFNNDTMARDALRFRRLVEQG